MIAVGVLLAMVAVVVNDVSESAFWSRVALVLLVAGLGLMAFGV